MNLLEPGDTAIVAVTGFFGNRIARMAERTGAKVVEVRAEYGRSPRTMRCSTRSTPIRTRGSSPSSTPRRRPVSPPVEELGRELKRRGSDTLLFVDCVTSLGAHPVEFDAWGFDYAYSCTQKALAAPPGMSPVAISDRALERVAARKTPVPFTFDLDLLRKYWVDGRPVPPHRADPPHLRAARGAPRRPRGGPREALPASRRRRRIPPGAGPQPRPRAARRPRLPARAAHRRVRPRGGRRQGVQARVLKEHDVEIGGGLGPDAPPIWRLGLMGHNARRDAADQVLAALDAVLADTKQLASTA